MTYEKALVLLGPLLCGSRARVSQEATEVLGKVHEPTRQTTWDFGETKLHLHARKLCPLLAQPDDEVTLTIDSPNVATSVWLTNDTTTDFLRAVFQRHGDLPC